MEKTKQFVLRNIAPPLGVLLVCILGAFLIYKVYYEGPYEASRYAGINPAGGETEVIFDSDGGRYYVINPEDVRIWSGNRQEQR